MTSEKNEKYIAPHKRNNINLFRKDHPKFLYTDEAFPTFNTPITKQKSDMDFKEKVKTEQVEASDTTDEVEPGMIRWKYDRKSQKWARKDGCSKEMDEYRREYELYQQEEKEYALIDRWQEYRDIQNELLKDLSPYWNMPSINSYNE